MAIPYPQDERSLDDLVADLSRETSALVRTDLALASTELTQPAAQAGRRRPSSRSRGGDDLDVEALREDIVQTRVAMRETVDAIQEELSPRRLVHEATETVREATVNKVST